MKILFVTPYSILLGANRSMLTIIKSVKEIGIEPIVICPIYGDLVEELEMLDVKVIIFRFSISCFYPGFRGQLGRVIRGFSNLITFPSFVNKIRKNRPVLIYSNSSVCYHGYLAAKWLKVKHVWHLREFGWEDYKCKHPFGLNYFRQLLLKSNCVICISKSIYDYFHQYENPVARIVHNGVEPVAAEISGKPKLLVGKIRFLMIGIIIENKGQLEALKAFEQLLQLDADIELVIVGDGDQKYLNTLKNYCEERIELKDRVIFTGFQKDTASFYKSCHYFLMFSKVEGFGRVTIEAMQYGLPVIGYDSTGTKEIIIDKFNGFLFTNFWNSLTCLFTEIRDEKTYTKLSENAIKTVNEKFSVKAYSNNICSSILDTLGK